MLTDSHAHLCSRKFDRDRELVIQNLGKDGIDIVIESGGSPESNRAAIALAERHSNIYATVGYNCAGPEMNEEILYEVKQTALSSNRVVGFGEIGLDYHHYPEEREVQRKWFVKLIRAAGELDLPIVVHDRKANDDTFNIIRAEKQRNPNLRGVLHCYSGNLALAREYVKLGFYLSIAGPVTYRSARDLQDVAKHIPLEWLFVETDSPYLTPGSLGKRRNEPAFVRYVAAAVAELRNIPFAEVARATSANVKRLYGIR